MQSNCLLFHMTEKAHYVQHVGLDILKLLYNPRFGWTYCDEDFMGKIAQIAKSSTRARGPLKIGHSLMFRWRNRLCVRWLRRQRAG